MCGFQIFFRLTKLGEAIEILLRMGGDCPIWGVQKFSRGGSPTAATTYRRASIRPIVYSERCIGLMGVFQTFLEAQIEGRPLKFCYERVATTQ